jgi:tellurite resistance protein
MSALIDKFTKQLHDDVEAVEERAKSLKKTIKSATKKTQDDIQSKLGEVKSNLEAKKHKFDEYRTELKTQFEQKEAEVKSNIEEWKTNREVEKLEHRADKSEEYAATAIAVAMLSMEEAEAATLEAICDRLDADTATQTIKK